ncbi:MAG: cytochrome P450 [Pseudomonadota bacterium]
MSQSPTDPAFVQDPYPAYRHFREYDAVWWEDYGMWVFPRFADVSAIFRDRRFGRQILHLASREELGWEPIPDHVAPFYAFEDHSLLEKEPPAHTRLRSLINRAFVSRRISDLKPGIEALARGLAKDLQPGDDLIERYCTPIPVTVIANLLGVPTDVAPRLLDWSHRMVAMYQARRDRRIEDDAVAATEAFTEFMLDWIARKRVRPADDLLSALIAAEEAGDRLSSEELVATAILLLNAGHEATVHALGNSIRTLVRQATFPTAGMVEELLRYDPPLHMFTRYVLQDLDWNGLPLKMGDQVGLLIGSANHDERVNPDPGCFDPDRVRPQHVSLGGGIHFCVGAPLARLEMAVGLTTLFETHPNLKTTPGPYRDTYHFHGLTSLRLV